MLLTLCFTLSAQTTWTVKSTADSGADTLRDTIAAAASGDTIVFDAALAGQTITLTSGSITIAKDLTIQGLGASQLTISGNKASRILVINNPAKNITISGLTFRDAYSSSANGGAIYKSTTASTGVLTISNCDFINNIADVTSYDGGAIYNYASSTRDATPSAKQRDPAQGEATYATASACVARMRSLYDERKEAHQRMLREGPPTPTVRKSREQRQLEHEQKQAQRRNRDMARRAARPERNLGTVRVDADVLVVSNCNFTGNAAYDGGAICDDGSDGRIKITGCTFSGNSANDYGGAVCSYADAGTDILSNDIRNCTFTGNFAPEEYGGALYLDYDSYVDGCTLTDNIGEYGGALFLDEPRNFTVTNSTFSNNEASYDDGGAIQIDNCYSAGTVSYCFFSENIAMKDYDGGAILFAIDANATGTVSHCQFIKNIGTDDSGAIDFEASTNTTVVLQDSIFYKNRAPRFGAMNCGNIYKMEISRCTFDNNLSSYDNGVVYLRSNINATFTISQCTFSNNTSPYYAALEIYPNTGSVANIVNSTFSGNKVVAGGYGGGIYTGSSGTTNISSCTIYNNESYDGGGVYRAETCTVNVRNSIIAGNTASHSNPDVYGTFVSQNYNLIGDVGTVTNFTGDHDQKGTSTALLNPFLDVLADNGGPSKTHALLSNSTAINRGFSGLTTDQRGAARPNAIDADDIGAYESGSTPAQPDIAVLGNGVNIVNGDASPTATDFTDFDFVPSGGASVRSFTIGNAGLLDLTITGTSPYITTLGSNASEFTVTRAPSTPLAPGASTTFEVTFTPTALGLREAWIKIPNNSPGEDPFVFAIQGYCSTSSGNVNVSHNSKCGATGLEFALFILLLTLVRRFRRLV